MGEIVVITSGKGGTGKSTVAVNLASALSVRGDRVLVVDADVGLRNVDILFGVQDSVVYDFLDVYDGYCTLEDCIIQVAGFENLSILAAPQSRNADDIGTKLSKVLNLVIDDYDYVLIDCPAGIELGFKNAVSVASRAIVVTQGYTAAIRDADRAIDSLEKLGINNIHLLINSVNPDLISNRSLWNLDSIVDTLGVPLIGVVPYDVRLMECAAGGMPVVNQLSISASAFNNIAMRLHGVSVPLAPLKAKKKRFNIFKKFTTKEELK